MTVVNRLQFAASDQIAALSPVGRYLWQFDPMKIDPCSVRLGVGREYEFASLRVSFNLRPLNANTIELQNLLAKNPASSESTTALTSICGFADRYRVILILAAALFTDLTCTVLIDWYQRFGFNVLNTSQMQRLPK